MHGEGSQALVGSIDHNAERTAHGVTLKLAFKTHESQAEVEWVELVVECAVLADGNIDWNAKPVEVAKRRPEVRDGVHRNPGAMVVELELHVGGVNGARTISGVP